MMDFFFDLCYMLPINIVATLGVLAYTGQQDYKLSGCVVSSLIILFLRALRHAGKKERILLSGVVIVAFAGLFWVLGEEKRAYIFEQYGFFVYIMAVGVVCILIGRLAQKYLWMKFFLMAALMGNLVYLMLVQAEVPNLTVAGSFLVIMIFLATIIQNHWEKSGYTDMKAHISLITPVLLVVFLMISVVPAPKEPMDWTIARNLWDKIVVQYNRFAGLWTGDSDDYSYAGFSEDGTFGEELGENHKTVMTVYTQGKSADRLYLGGITLEDFSGRGWTSDLEEEGYFEQFDMLETRGSITKYKLGYERDYAREETLSIVNRLLNTRHVFLPGKTNMLSDSTEIPEYSELENRVLTDSKLRYGDTYTLSYYRINPDNTDLIDAINVAEPLSEAEWKDVVRVTIGNKREGFSYEDYVLYHDSLYEKYGEKPGLSGNVTALVDRITEGAEGDYGKLKAIADFLKTMEYDTNPGPIPEKVTNGTEFLDYFLFESGKGYCAHYATAFVLLARECGFPARYVQGYHVITDGEAGAITVTENDAHAWAEVYFDNFGWITFEATPGFSVSKGWNAGKKVDVGEQFTYYQYMQEEMGTEEPVVEIAPQEEEKKVFQISYIVIPVLSAVFFGALFIFISRLVANHKYRKMSHGEKIRLLTQRNLKILRLLGYPITANETIDEYRQRLTVEMQPAETRGGATEGSDMGLSFLDIYVKLLYSDYEVTDSDISVAEKSRDALRQKLKRHGVKYFFFFL